jgi:hypothetical protein
MSQVFCGSGGRSARTGLQLIKDHFAAALYIKAGFDAGFLRYVIHVAERP